MPIYVEWPDSPALIRRMAEMQAAVRTGSHLLAGARRDIRKIVVDGHAETLLRGVDRYGQPRAALAESTLKDPRRGPGPSLIPRGRQSRFIANFEATWVTESGGTILVCRYVDVLSKTGKSFVQYHLEGCPPDSNPKRPNWSLPKRDVSGLPRLVWNRIIERHAQFARDVVRFGGGR